MRPSSTVTGCSAAVVNDTDQLGRSGGLPVSAGFSPEWRSSAPNMRQWLVGAAHAPSLHTWPAAQACPHAPQLAGLVPVSTHALPQVVAPGAHTHEPPWHACAGPHATPQLPQCAGSLDASTQALPHAVSPGSQAAAHWPPEHG